MTNAVAALLMFCSCIALAAGQNSLQYGGRRYTSSQLHCDGPVGTGQMPWGQGNYQGCTSCPNGWGLKPVNSGDPGLIGCVHCSDNGVDNCQKCCIPNGTHFCGEAYLSYGCCDWCVDYGFDNPPTHGVCYTTGTSPQVADPTGVAQETAARQG